MNSIRIRLNKIGKSSFNKYKKDLEDIVLFGSFVKGKESPKDIDLLMIFKNKVDKKIELEFKKEMNIPEADINSITSSELEGEGFIAKEGIYLEGISIVDGKPLNERLGFTSVAFLKYDLSKIKGSERVKFYYALQGRKGSRGFLGSVAAKRYAESVIVCDYDELERLKAFFEHWKIELVVTPALVPKRLKHILLK